MNEIKVAAGLVVCAVVIALVYGVLFSLIYPLVDIDASLISLFAVLGLATCVLIKAVWSLVRRKKA
jgi:hypothetical protein